MGRRTDWHLEATHLPTQEGRPPMVSVSVRQNRPEPIGRNAQPRNRVYPHPENPGLIEQVDGYYDWAGRRLFLEDGSPDPATPGTYRYQTRPDLCDLAAPDSDPASPRYEPPHLRHKPGDTWIIDRNRPHDPDDSGSFGSPGWRPDPRTGRHRRDELPDPIPPWEAGGAAQDNAEEAAGQADVPEVGGGEPPWRPRRRTSTPAPEPEPEAIASPAPHARPGLPITPDRSEPTPRRSPRFWQEEQEERKEERSGRETAQEEPWRFEKLREDAWDRFVIKSSELAAAHWADRRTLEYQHRWPVAMVLRMFRWLTAVVEGRSANKASVSVATPLPVPRQVQPHADQAPRTAEAARSTQSAEAARSALSREDSRQAAQEARPVPGAQMAQAIRSVQAARVRLAAAARETRADQGGAARQAAQSDQTEAVREAQSDQAKTARHAAQATRGAAPRSAGETGGAHWRGRPREERPRPSPLPYMARWERAFDAHRAFGEAVVL
ncbi:hypothetical protein [Glycomyces rhizosphaerae]|uniref:Uncharacterized protein n=1 Tax=Glycomyces rhizosphaerae TaxID=2054422 RepID=A0ABV7PZU4_9ACTN